MRLKTNISVVALTGMIAFTTLMSGCGKRTSYKKPADDDDTVYNIGIVSENGSSDLEKGFTDALSDTFGKEHVNLMTEKLSSGDGAAETEALEKDGASVILTESETALVSAYSVLHDTDDASVISVNVQDIRRALGLDKDDDDNDGSTGVNVTGISSKPYVDKQLSEMIEATSEINRVGIMYSPEDTDSVKTDRVLEEYLGQAGIEYREYILPSSLYRNIPRETDGGSATVLNEIKKSDDTDPTVPLISDGFAQSLHPGYDSAKAIRWEKKARKNLTDASDDDIIDTAIRQNDAVFVAGDLSGSQLLKLVTKAADSGVTTFGGSRNTGRQTLVTLWSDPYDTGYQAGKMAYQILVGGQKAADIPVTQVSQSSLVKLYNGDYARKLDKEFPKSFHEYSEYIKDYTPGENTQRVEN